MVISGRPVLRVFVSSTSLDLEAHREKVTTVIGKHGALPVRMEWFTACAAAPVEVCVERVRACDVLIVIVAHRYGWVPEPGSLADGSKSITWIEVDQARAAGKPVLAFLVDERCEWDERLKEEHRLTEGAAPDDVRNAGAGLKRFKAFLGATFTRALFTTPDSLASEVSTALAALPPPIAAPETPRTNIDPPVTRFIGRAREVEELTEWLTQPDCRVVTLTGPAGVGKTRLSRELATALVPRIPGGCWFVDLREATTATGIAHAVGQAFGVPLIGRDQPEQAVTHVLAGRSPLLLVLDNFEQVAGHAAETIGVWLRGAPTTRMLVTSRELLGVYGETEFRIEPLATPSSQCVADLEAARSYDSVRLFLDRAARSRRGFALTEANAASVIELCVRLDGNPLALELAAAQSSTFTPAQLLHRLGRVRSGLNDAIDMSYRLLHDWEKRAFLQACVFRGGFLLEAIEQVLDLAGFLNAPSDPADVVRALYEKSLLRADEVVLDELRYTMYVAIQEYGRQKWAEVATPAERTALAERHARYYLGYTQDWAKRVHSADAREALDRLGLELDNVLAVQEGAEERGAPELGADVLLAYAETLDIRGPTPLRIPRLERARAALGGHDAEREVALLAETSNAYWSVGAWNQAEVLAEQAVKVASGFGRSPARAAALAQLARMRYERGRSADAVATVREAREIFREVGDAVGVIAACRIESMACEAGGGDRTVLECLAEAEACARRLDDRPNIARIHNSRGLEFWHQGEPAKAVDCYRQAQEVSRTLGDRRWLGGYLTNEGLALADLELFDEALARFAEADPIHREVGNRAWAAVNIGSRGRVLRLRDGPTDRAAAFAVLTEAADLSGRIPWPQDTAMHLGERGRLLLTLGRLADARQDLVQAITIQQAIHEDYTLRHFGNLVTLARVELTSGKCEASARIAADAMKLAIRIGVQPDRVPRPVRADWEHLFQLLEAP